MKNEGPKRYTIDEFTENGWGETYNLTKEEAWRLLKQHEVSDARTTQVLNQLLNEGTIDGRLIGKGHVKDRGWRISEESLRLYIQYKKLTFGDFQDLMKRLENGTSDEVIDSEDVEEKGL